MNNTINKDIYYVPEQSAWPIIGAFCVFLLATGFVNFLHEGKHGKELLFLGLASVLAMMFGWFRAVAKESLSGLYNKQMDSSFRMSMTWFIFSEVCFFMAFFGALFYIREFALPWLQGLAATKSMTGKILWPNFQAAWPLLSNPGDNFVAPKAVINPWGLPLVNTALLLTSSVTLTIAHHALKDNHRKQLLIFTGLTALLGLIFLYLQASEYKEAYHELGLTLGSGIYGSTFFMLTGFHGAHVTIGTIMLIVMFIRAYKNHFTKEKHFAFEAAAWYWHFVDVVWVGLFIFVYCV